jgi:hypothetical protein
MTTFSANFRKAMMDQETGQVPVMLLTVYHVDLDEPFRISSDNKDLLDFEKQLRGTISRNSNFGFLPMNLTLPNEGEDAEYIMKVTLYGIGTELTPVLRGSIEPATVIAEVVLASAPNVVEMTFAAFELTDTDVAAGDVTLDLSIDSYAAEPYPADTFTPARFGSLWSTA